MGMAIVPSERRVTDVLPRVVSSGGAPIPAGTSMFTKCTHMKCEVKHNGDMGMGHYGVGHLCTMAS